MKRKNIFSAEEMGALLPTDKTPLLTSTTKDTGRLDRLRDTLKAIKDDYETHDALMRLYGEAEGFVMNVFDGTYLSHDEPDPRAVYLAPRLNLGAFVNLLLVTNRSRENSIVLGYFGREYIRTPEHFRGSHPDNIESVLNVYVPDQNTGKILQQVGRETMGEPEEFALRLLCAKGTVDLTGKDETYVQAFADSRTWRPNRKSCFSGFTIAAPIDGQDVLPLYKKAVKRAMHDFQKIDERRWHPESIQLFNRNMYPTKQVVTKVGLVREKPLYL